MALYIFSFNFIIVHSRYVDKDIFFVSSETGILNTGGLWDTYGMSLEKDTENVCQQKLLRK